MPANLDAATGSENVRVRRAAYRLAFGLDDTQRFRFVKRGLGDNDSLVRLLAAQQAHSLPRGVRRDEVLGAMLEDRWHAIRLRGLRLIAYGRMVTR